MLVSMVKFLLFIALIVGLIFGVDLLMREGEGLRLAVADTEFTLGPVQAVLAGIVLLIVVWLLLKALGLLVAVLRWVVGDETAITRYFARNRERRGYTALSEGLTALASGDPDEALAKASKAEALLRRPELTGLIKAQAAEMGGNKLQAAEAYKRLLKNDNTRFVGVRGLLKQKMEEGDTETALKLAEKAFVLKPRHSETSDTLLQLQARHENWRGARKTLGAKLKYGSIPRDLHKRRDAVLALSESRQKMAAGDEQGARDEAIEANRLAPGLVPGAVMAARAYIDMDKPRNAAKVLKQAWALNPHPDLAATFAEIEPDESPSARIKRFADLTRQNAGHEETRMLNAELEIAAENFPAARKALGDLPDVHPTARTLTLRAAIERGTGAPETEVRAWLAKALTASRGPQWICDACGQVHRDWTAICSNCGGFDTLAWKEAPMNEAMADSSTAMLPLIVGALDRDGGKAEPARGGNGAAEPAPRPAAAAPEPGVAAPPEGPPSADPTIDLDPSDDGEGGKGPDMARAVN